MKQRKSELLNILLNPTDPMVIFFRPIEQLQKLTTAARIPYSSAQILAFGLTLIRSTRDFTKGLSNWNSKPAVDKTLVLFKTHFKDGQTELKDIKGSTMQQVGYHHANMLATQLHATIDGQGVEMLAMLQKVAAGSSVEETPAHDPSIHAATAAVQ